MSQKEKLRRVEDVMDEVGLTSVKDVKIGNVFYKGISGGTSIQIVILVSFHFSLLSIKAAIILY